MAVTTNKALLFVGGGIAAAAIVAYAAGAFNARIDNAPKTIATLPENDQAVSKDASPPETQPPAVALQTPAEQTAAPEVPAPAPETGAPARSEPVVVPPSFDVVRVEGDGSIVVAGKAAPNAKVDLLVGSNVIGSAEADAGGDFAVVLDDPLEPGDYQIVLRATAPDNVVAMSIETAVVSVPETAEGQVLALVEEPGKPSQMITLPQPQAPAAVAKPPEDAAPPTVEAPAVETPAAPEPRSEGNMQAALPEQAEPAPAPPPPAGPAVRVEAVEIDGRKIFVAGVADPGRTVRGYANEILLGDAEASPDGRYLIEADRDLPVGDYIIRVDALEPDGVKVAARAAVPFEREPGQTIAAVAPPEPVTPSAPATPPAVAKPTADAPAASAPAAPSTEAPPAVAKAPVPEQVVPPPPATEEAPAAAVNSPATEPPAAAFEAPAAQPAESAPNPPAIDTAPAAPGSQLAAEKPTTQQPAVEKPSATTTSTEVFPAPTPEMPAASSPAVAEAPAAQPPEAAEAPAPEVPAAIKPPTGETETDVAAAPAPELPAPPSADGVSEVLAPKLQSVDSAVIIRRGDTLWRISRRVYGRGVRYSTIYLANEKQIEDPDRIWPGQVFKVPEKSNDGKADADYSRLGNRLTTVPKDGTE